MATHKQLMKQVAEQANLPMATVERVYAFLRQEIKNALAEDGVAKLDDLVTFQVVAQAARTARNPKTGEPVDIPARKTVKAKVSGPVKAFVGGV